ncbi:MAG: hypothetical protein RL189_318 [Pseudomonadota bacterium]
MGNCCQSKSCELQKMQKSQARVLWVTLAINATLFFAELIGGLIAGSIAVTSDSLDMLGDAIAYGSSLYVIHKGARAKALSASLKGFIMIACAVGVLLQAGWKIFYRTPPETLMMGGLTLVALLANVTCLILLTRHRHDDVNMSSVWICSRNDLIANTSVLAAAGLVAMTNSAWPDIVVGLGIALLFLKSGINVLKTSRLELISAQPQQSSGQLTF